MNLFEVAVVYRDTAERLADLDIDDQTLADTLDAEAGIDLRVKATNIAMVCRNLEVTAQAIKDAEQQMAARRKAIDNRISRLKRYLLDGMQLAGITKIDSPHFQIARRTNPPSVDVFEPGMVPAGYMRNPPPPPPELDKKAIAAALKSGLDVPGCRLTQTERVEIR